MRRPTSTLLPVLTLAALAARAPLAAQARPFLLGPIAAQPGEKASGYLDVPAGVDSGTRIPVTVIQGREAGPVLALIAGTHGVEYNPILALQRVRHDLDPAQLKGTVIIVHVANLPSFQRRTIYYGPIDWKNLNRVYPGKRDGTVSERIAWMITTRIIEQCDYLVDMHSGDGNEDLIQYSYWNKLGLDARTDSIGRAMVLAWGSPGVVIDTARPHDLEASVYTQNTAQLRGRPSITTEVGSLGQIREDMIQRNEDGVFRLLRYFAMLPGPATFADHPAWYGRTEVLESPATGVWFPLVDGGQWVPAGTVVGYVTDYFGERLAEVTAPFAGVMLYVVKTPPTTRGEPVGMVGAPQAQP
jgi:predicted deacylase